MKRKGFTLVELLVVIAIIALLMGILMPALARVRQIAHRMVCGSNLRGIGTASMVYANDYDQELPDPPSSFGKATWGVMTNAYAEEEMRAYRRRNPTCTITSLLFQLVKYADVTTKSFVCKGDAGTEVYEESDDWEDLVDSGLTGDITFIWDFGDDPGKYCSYTYHQPFKAGDEYSFPLKVTSNPASPWSSDRNPYQDLNTSSAVEEAEWTGGEYKDLDKLHNSGSHQNEGQNVLYLGGHVKFEHVANVGVNKDNIWGVWGIGETDPQDADRQTGIQFLSSDSDRSLRPSTVEDAFLVGETNSAITP